MDTSYMEVFGLNIWKEQNFYQNLLYLFWNFCSYSYLCIDDYVRKLPMIHSLYGWFIPFITSTNGEGQVITGICVSTCLSIHPYVCLLAELWKNVFVNFD